ncbi:MAG TPA: (2Fe-2S)-binding protein [Usitatibacter sp.]|nr:(2Fe-2S)-binding protein [Usitatibacter sp.]
MFRKPPEAAGAVTVQVAGRAVKVPAGCSAAAAAMIAGLSSTRTSPVNGEPRAAYCMMGVCFECLLVIDGEASQQGCMVPVREGMRIERQEGPRTL